MTEKKIESIVRHITREMFCDWQENKLTQQEEQQFLNHIGACTFCAEQFGSWMEEEFLPNMNLIENCNMVEPPIYLKDEILYRTHQKHVQVSVQMKATSRQMQLIMYSLRVGVAVVASIYLLTVTSAIQNMNVNLPDRQQPQHTQEENKESFIDKLHQGSRGIADSLNEFAAGLLHIEFGSSNDEQN